MNEYFFPKLQAVEAFAPYRLRTTWSTGEVLVVDVEGPLRTIPALAPILKPAVFARVHMGEWGNSIEWLDEEFGADNVYAWAKEQAGRISHEMFGEWMHRNGLSLSTAAEALGISQRMVSYYRTAHKAIPRQTWLACLGWEATRPKGRTIPRGLPTTNRHMAVTV
uniref:DUF2442 domain-containing protein n=1 Tax=Candidatus Kentrum sp. FM TaxID=2126340 RepID=A0A450W983_9GAMM|nr:MAG: Protein of unknown function (DUF2442) [Candidatus Kentron sp. FM]VFJ61171.1 MAG: Protein of unknown function (DUF2442) [Candidatus Kentron sp. FM]VFK13599.1 MAG: Protein of unknown function (DUF2442) [Candidatus Kentron sp. FM]